VGRLSLDWSRQHTGVRAAVCACLAMRGETGGIPRMISTSSGGIFARWSPEGSRLFYLTLNGDLMTVDIVESSTQGAAPSLGQLGARCLRRGER
jgi:hypothetical protein